jgi:protein-tyrosine phosphatase
LIANFSWIIPGRLAGAAIPDEAYYPEFAPAGADGAAGDLADLYSRGIRCLVSLTDRAARLGPACGRAGLKWIYHPIVDFGVPSDTDAFDGLISTVIEHMDRSQAVCVHCYAGIGRTGLVLCCTAGRYLRLPPAQAISRVRSLRPALETREQERFVHRYLSKT